VKTRQGKDNAGQDTITSEEKTTHGEGETARKEKTRRRLESKRQRKANEDNTTQHTTHAIAISTRQKARQKQDKAMKCKTRKTRH
jgi:hypothetical protein